MMRPALMPAAAPVNESCDLLCGKINMHLQWQESAIPFAPQNSQKVAIFTHISGTSEGAICWCGTYREV